MNCPTGISALIQQAQLRVYTGPQSFPAVGGSQNFTFAVSDVVPPNKYWLLLGASVLCLNTVAMPSAGVALYALAPGATLPSNKGTYGQWSIFGNLVLGVPDFAAVCNGIPLDPAHAIRIDESTSNDGVTNPVGQAAPFEQALIRNGIPRVLGPSWSVIAHTEISPSLGNQRQQLTLKILVVELNLGQDVAWLG